MAVERASRLVGQAIDLLDAASVPPEITAPLETAMAGIRGATPTSPSPDR